MNSVQNVKENQPLAVERWLSSPNVRAKFDEVLGKAAPGFVASILSVTKNNKLLMKAEASTIMSAAMTAATLKLPINPNLGLAYIVPYKNEAQFQMGWKGFVQLAERSGQYRTINANVVYEGQIEDIDFITGEIVRGKKKSDTVIGYVAYLELVNGFRKTFYMTKDEVMAHAKKYSQSFKKGFGVWAENFDAMALKTVLKLLISKYGIMSIDMQGSAMATAMAADQAVVEKGGTYRYVDNDGTEYEVEDAPAEEQAEMPKAETEAQK